MTGNGMNNYRKAIALNHGEAADVPINLMFNQDAVTETFLGVGVQTHDTCKLDSGGIMHCTSWSPARFGQCCMATKAQTCANV